MKELGKFFDYKKREKEIAKEWKEGGVFAFKQGRQPLFTIDTPPPTVSGSLHMGHVFSYVQADVIARYKRLCGFNVFYPIGFDDNGLPTERLVEKLTGKKAMKNSTKEEFVEECYKVVEASEKEFEELFTSIGLSVDFGLKYQTISPKTAEISQNSFIDLYNKGLIYKKLAPVYFDVVDKTALAQADIEEKEMEGFEVTYKALIEIKQNTFEKVEIMTTRAEMMPACVCVLYNPQDGRYTKFAGKKILLPSLGSAYKLEVPLIADEDVSIEKGTGLVMCCAFGDMQDKIWIERHNLWHHIPQRYVNAQGMPLGSTKEPECEVTQNLITDDGFLNDDLYKKEDGKFMKVEEGWKFILEKMVKAGVPSGMNAHTNFEFEEALAMPHIKLNKISHYVKCGERSGKPVEILFKEQYYLSVLPFKRDFKEVIKKIDFYPFHMKVKLENWIEGLNQDWCISRQRFFGIAVPCRNFEYEDDVSRETLQNIAKDFYEETLKPVLAKYGAVFHEDYFEMQSETLHILMQSPEYLSFEDGFTQSCLDLEIKNIGISKYKVEVNRNLEGLFAELLQEVKVPYSEFFILNDKNIKTLEEIITKKTKEIEETGIKNLKIKTEDLVLDTWFTSSVSPQIAWGSLMEAPVFDLRPQAHEIIRTWAFYTIVKAYLHSLELKSPTKVPNAGKEFNSREFFRMKENPNIIPWKNVMLSGWCLASDKTKMSKSKGNAVTPLSLIEEKGVDVVRLWCASASLGTDVAYKEDTLEVGRKFVNKLWNVGKFFAMKKDTLKQDAEITENFDKWIIAKLAGVVLEYQKYMNTFEYSKAKETLDSFFWNDLCDNYLEIIKVRYYGLEALIYKEKPPQNPVSVALKQQSCLQTLNIIFKTILALYSPFACFITEELHNLFYGSSIYKGVDISKIMLPKFKNLECSEEAIKVIDAVRKYKTEHSLAMNAQIEKFEFKTLHNLAIYLEDLKNVTGVKEFKFS